MKRIFRPVVVNGYTVKGEARYESLWDKSKTGPWEERSGMSATGLQNVFNDLKKKRYRMEHVSGYAVGKEARFAAIWEKRTTVGWEARVGLTSAQYQAKTDEMVKKSYRPVQIHGYTVNGKTYFAGIWEKNDGRSWVARHNMSSKKYQEDFAKWVKKGYRLKVMSGYPSETTVKYAALWEKK